MIMAWQVERAMRLLNIPAGQNIVGVKLSLNSKFLEVRVEPSDGQTHVGGGTHSLQPAGLDVAYMEVP